MSFLKSVKNVMKKVGLTKKNLAKATPLIAAINPVAGMIAGGLSNENPVSGVAGALTGAVLGGLAAGSSNLLSAAGRIPGLTTGISNIIKQPAKFVQNTLASGGNVAQALVNTLGLGGTQAGNLLGGLNIPGIDLDNFGIKDAVGLYSMIQYFKAKEIEPPTPATYEFMTPETNKALLDAFSANLDESTKKNLEVARENYSARGLYRSGMLGEEEAEINRKNALAKATKQAELTQQSLEYNNKIRQQQYEDYLKNYGIQSGLEAQKIASLGEMAGDWLAGVGGKEQPPSNTNKESTIPNPANIDIAWKTSADFPTTVPINTVSTEQTAYDNWLKQQQKLNI